MIKNLFILLITTFVLASCNLARFDRYPGVYQDMIPLELQGTYVYYGKDHRSRKTDTLQIQVAQNYIQLESSSDNQKQFIHQHFQLTKLNDVFVYACSDNSIHSLWNLFILEPKENGIRMYPVFDLKEPSSTESTMIRYLSFQDLLLHHDPVQATPNAIDGSGAAPTETALNPDNIRYFMASEDQLYNYYEKELKDKEYIFLKALAKAVGPGKVKGNPVKKNKK